LVVGDGKSEEQASQDDDHPRLGFAASDRRTRLGPTKQRCRATLSRPFSSDSRGALVCPFQPRRFGIAAPLSCHSCRGTALCCLRSWRAKFQRSHTALGRIQASAHVTAYASLGRGPIFKIGKPCIPSSACDRCGPDRLHRTVSALPECIARATLYAQQGRREQAGIVSDRSDSRSRS
jgi:hypothetical protein